eukprot:4628806-Alexandrium_andersonii.AAC.1
MGACGGLLALDRLVDAAKGFQSVDFVDLVFNSDLASGNVRLVLAIVAALAESNRCLADQASRMRVLLTVLWCGSHIANRLANGAFKLDELIPK